MISGKIGAQIGDVPFFSGTHFKMFQLDKTQSPDYTAEKKKKKSQTQIYRAVEPHPRPGSHCRRAPPETRRRPPFPPPPQGFSPFSLKGPPAARKRKKPCAHPFLCCLSPSCLTRAFLFPVLEGSRQVLDADDFQSQASLQPTGFEPNLRADR